MIGEKIQSALNKQVNMELYSAYLYLAMSTHFLGWNFEGFSRWMRAQAQEELLHAMKLFDYVNERGGRVTLSRVEEPPRMWATVVTAFEDAYAHERENTILINELMALATREEDHATAIFLQWFVTEQVEEEASASRIVEKLKLVGESAPALLMLDRELGMRTS